MNNADENTDIEIYRQNTTQPRTNMHKTIKTNTYKQ